MASPLFDEYDPYGIQRRRALRTGDRKATISDLMPEEQKQSMLRYLAAKGGSGIGGLLWLLDTPGAVVRGTLEGGPLKGLSALLPGSERVSGRDLLRSYGMADDDDTWGNFAGGIGAEILTDPLTYLTLGANQVLGRGVSTVSGGIAKKLNVWKYIDSAAAAAGKGPRRYAREATLENLLDAMPAAARKKPVMPPGQAAPRTAAERLLESVQEASAKTGLSQQEILAMPLAKSHGWSVPLYGSGAVDLFGKSAGDALARFGDSLGAKVGKIPGVSLATTAFDNSVLGMLDPDKFADARRLSLAREAGIPALMYAPNSLVYDFNEAMRQGIPVPGGQALTTDSPLFKRALRNAFEDTLPYMHSKAGTPEERAVLDVLLAPGANNPVRALVDWWQSFAKDEIASRRAAGVQASELKPQAKIGGYFQRQITPTERPLDPVFPQQFGPSPVAQTTWWNRLTKRLNNRRMRGEQVAQVSDRATMQRQPYLDLPAGTEMLNAATLDKDFMEKLRAAPDAEARQLWIDWSQANFPQLMADAAQEWQLSGFGPQDLGPLSWLYSPNAQTIRHTLPKSHPLAEALRQSEDALRRAALNSRKAVTPAEIQAARVAQRQARAAVKGIRKQIRDEALPAREEELYKQLTDFVRRTDPQLVEAGVPVFGNDPINDLLSYARNAAEAKINADFATGLLARAAQNVPVEQVPGGGGYNLLRAAEKLGLDVNTIANPLRARLAAERGIPLSQVPFAEELASNWSIDSSLVDDWASRVAPGQLPAVVNPLFDVFNSYTRAFKTAALANPARYVRDQYSGKFAAATQGLYSNRANFVGSRMRAGDYGPLGDLLEPLDTPEWRDLSTGQPLSREARIKKFLVDAASQGLTTGTEQGAMSSVAANAAMRGPYIGATPLKPKSNTAMGKLFGTVDWLPEARPGESLASRLGRAVAPPAIAGEDLFTRVRRGYLWDQNPIAKYSGQWAEWTDANNRFDTYLEAILQGNSPAEAKRLTDLTQVDYSPGALTEFERKVMANLFPFYRYTRGIIPLVYENAMAVPAARRMTRPKDLLDPLAYGLNPQTLAMRIIDRASTPTENRFVPESLRQQASIPIEAGLPLIGLPAGSALSRSITNIDLPWAPLNLLSGGIGNTPYETAMNTLTSTGLNVLGQLNPLPKTILESLTNRQFFSGNQLSDLYSMLEQGLGAPGRSLEQFTAGIVPGGSKALGIARTLLDDRLTTDQAILKVLFNNLTGLRVKDYDEARAQQFAARDVLTKLLAASKDVREYQTLSVKPEDLAKMPQQERDMYLLYKIVQAEAVKKARERKKAEAAGALLSR